MSVASNITEVHKDCLLKINEKQDDYNKKFHKCEQKITEISKESNRSMKLSKEN